MSTQRPFEQNPDLLAEYVCSAAFGTARGAPEFGASFPSRLFNRASRETGHRQHSRAATLRRGFRLILRVRNQRTAHVARHGVRAINEPSAIAAHLQQPRRNASVHGCDPATGPIKRRPTSGSDPRSSIASARSATRSGLPQMSIVTSLSGRAQQISALPPSGRSSGSVV